MIHDHRLAFERGADDVWIMSRDRRGAVFSQKACKTGGIASANRYHTLLVDRPSRVSDVNGVFVDLRFACNSL